MQRHILSCSAGPTSPEENGDWLAPLFVAVCYWCIRLDLIGLLATPRRNDSWTKPPPCFTQKKTVGRVCCTSRWEKGERRPTHADLGTSMYGSRNCCWWWCQLCMENGQGFVPPSHRLTSNGRYKANRVTWHWHFSKTVGSAILENLTSHYWLFLFQKKKKNPANWGASRTSWWQVSIRGSTRTAPSGPASWPYRDKVSQQSRGSRQGLPKTVRCISPSRAHGLPY